MRRAGGGGKVFRGISGVFLNRDFNREWTRTDANKADLFEGFAFSCVKRVSGVFSGVTQPANFAGSGPDVFGKVLMAELKRSGALAGTCTDPKRRLEIGDYLGLFLFGQLNPVVDSMQGLCAASQFKRVQEQVCGSAVSLGSFSEARALVEPQLLERVFENLVSQCARKPQKGLEGRELLAIESTLWRVVRRMDWAY
jgi:hypothetical protein